MQKKSFAGHTCLYMYGALVLLQVFASHGTCLAKEDDLRNPQAAINCFITYWSRANYKKMYALLTKRIRGQISFSEFEKRYLDFQRDYGLPLTYEIQDILQDMGNKSRWSVNIQFSNSHIGSMVRQTWCESEGEDEGWRIGDGTFVEPDFNRLFQ